MHALLYLLTATCVVQSGIQNALPEDLRAVAALAEFRKHLKTHGFASNVR